MMNNNKIIDGELHDDSPTREQAAFCAYLAANPMATYRSTWQAALKHQDENEFSTAYMVLANENDRLRDLLTERGIVHQVKPVVYPTVEDVMKAVLNYQFEERENVTGTTNWAANIGMVVVNLVKELNQ